MNISRQHILILTTSTGGGHMNLAQALKETLGTHYSVTIADPYPTILHHYYSALSRYFLGFWNWQYVAFDNYAGALLLHNALTLMLKRRVIALFEQHQPQLIISTHALLSYEISQVNEQLNTHIPLVYQLTDLEEVHKAWFIGKHAEAYLAPTREICEQAIRQGVEQERVHVTGRPVRQQFFNQPPSIRTDTLKALGLDPNVFTIFLQGGAKGSAGLKQTVSGILTAEVPMQIILAVGNNKALASRFAGIARLKVLPFTQTIAPYMAASDVIVGKAGASFLSEAFTLEKPCLITSIIPGQEAPSLRFIERHNLGWVRFEAEAQKQLLTTLASNPAMMAEKVASIQTYKAWNIQANQSILPLIAEVLQDREGALEKEDLVP